MAKIDFDAIGTSKNNSNTSNGPYIGFVFFKDKAGNPVQPIVRFPYGSAKDFDLMTVHTVKDKNGRFRTVNCLADRNNPDAKCPFCEHQEKAGKASLRFIVKLIAYEQDDNGNIVVAPKTWNAPFSVAKQLKAMMEEYGDLKNWVFKIKQQKEGNQTSYAIIPTRQDLYSADVYKIDFSAFEKQPDAIKYQVLNKTAEDMEVFLKDGAFPEKQFNNAAPSTSKNLDKVDTAGADEALGFDKKYDDSEAVVRPTRTDPVTTEDIPQRPRRYTY